MTRVCLLAALLVVVVAGGGCLKCNYTAYGECLQPVEQAVVPAPARARVYVFLMNGLDVLDLGGMKELECAIVNSGFPKVYYAQRFDEAWYYRELHRLHREDANNRFVLIGIGAAAKQLHELAGKVTNDGILLDAVIFLDPARVNAGLGENYPSKVIRSHHWVGSPLLKPEVEAKLDKVGHLHLPDNPASVSLILDVLLESALKVAIPSRRFDCMPLLDENKPVPRPSEPKRVPLPPPGWDVLCPESGHLSDIGHQN